MVTFDERSLSLDGKRTLILSGAVHYPRSTPAMWPRILREARRAGLNCIETYVFWEGHEPQPGEVTFAGRYDLGRFLDLCQAEGLYAILRIGPYVCAETNFGGLPWWLIARRGMVTRTLNRPFMKAVEAWVGRLLREVGDRQYTRGGPVILAQMENEYGNVAHRYGADGQAYLAWCADLARNAGLDVPLIMCEGAPAGVIETLNGFSVWGRVEEMRGKRPGQPLLWTEDWLGWYDTWGEPHHLRKAEDIAYEALRFCAVGGSGINYYMWHGGTNFERDAMFLQTTSYDCDAALDEYGLPTDKAEHLRLMHDCLRGHAEFLLEGAVQAPEVLVPGRLPQHADGVVLHAFRRGARELAIVVNGNDWPKRVTARGLTLDLPNHGAAVLAGDRRRHALVYRSWVGPEVRVQRRMLPAGKTLRWQMAADPLPGTEPCRPLAFRPVKLPHNMLLATRDETDYGWYRTEFVAARGGTARLAVTVADLLSVWVNGVYAGTVPERLEEERQKAAPPPCSLDVTLERGRNTLLLLADAIGMIKGDWMIDAPQSRERKGLLSKVTLDGRPVAGPWEFAGGLWGEGHRRFDPVTDSGPAWGAPTLAGGPLRWYRAGFRVTAAELAQPAPWAVEVGGLCKGFIWVNGRGIGRYWQLPARDARRARYGNHPHLLNTGHDQPVQRYYHIPADWLREGGNHLVVLEERGALPRGARLVRRH